MVKSRPIPGGGQPTNVRIIITAQVLPKERAHNGLPSPGVLHWEEKTPESLALKASGVYFLGELEVCRKLRLHS